jgi:hypothetical protein
LNKLIACNLSIIICTGTKTALLHNLAYDVGSEVIDGNCEPDGSSLLLNMRSLFEPNDKKDLVKELLCLLKKYGLTDVDGNISLPLVSNAGKVQTYIVVI